MARGDPTDLCGVAAVMVAGQCWWRRVLSTNSALPV
jgi:hypothetical protein